MEGEHVSFYIIYFLFKKLTNTNFVFLLNPDVFFKAYTKSGNWRWATYMQIVKWVSGDIKWLRTEHKETIKSK